MELRLGLVGAPPDTGNLGVSALGAAFLELIAERLPGTKVVVFDNGRGVRHARDGHPVEQRVGWRHSRHLERPETMRSAHVAACAGMPHPLLDVLRSCDVVADISGGDSFSDLYGHRRFDAVALPKRTVIQLGVPLLLLPQTYGPFASLRRARQAEQIIGHAAAAWTRTGRPGHGAVAAGVDLAFGLRPRPWEDLPDPLMRRLVHRERRIVGLNVSGLLDRTTTGGPIGTPGRGELSQLVVDLVAAGNDVVLVSHVFGHLESDLSAANRLRSRLDATVRKHVFIAPRPPGPGQAKWLIAHFDWFAGSRMHATIAAMSSGVPTFGLAYSDKFAEVFDTVGGPHRLLDLRLPGPLDLREVIAHATLAPSLRAEAVAAATAMAARVDQQAAELVGIVARAGHLPVARTTVPT